MKRRDFIKLSGCFVATASLTGVGCGDDDGQAVDAGPTNTYSFPEGVASGDPHPASVMLWTRVVAEMAETTTTVTAEVADSDTFDNIVATTDMDITAASDWTLRLLVEGLNPATWYWYRFRAGNNTSTVGRTRTAPAKTADVRVNLAWTSCQDYVAGLYDAWTQMIEDDKAAAADDQIHFVLQVGDFIYETRGSGFQGAIGPDLMPIELNNRDGSPRTVEAFPSGGGVVDDETFAVTLDDYRHLYKQFLRDPALQEARARWPFVQTWDDHEFTNDAWQSQANFDEDATLGEASQNRKVAANQAWFEYIPANLSGADSVPGVTPAASDFVPADVNDTAFTDFDSNLLATNADNLAAINSMTIYRSLRFGANVELIMTDLRSYRSDHAIEEDLTVGNPAFFDPRNALPIDMVNIFDAGMTANGGSPPSQVLGVTNTRMTSPPGTCMGATQKQWFKDTLSGSDATWKVWGNEFPLFRVLVRQGPLPLLADRVANADAWDGYNYERKELMAYIASNSIANVVAFSGDVHAHYAGYVNDDYDADVGDQTPVMVEFTAAGIASNSLFSFFEKPTREGTAMALRPLITYDATDNPGGAEPLIENMNCTILYGSYAANAAAVTARSDAMAKAAIDAERLSHPDANPHLTYVDTNAQGYGVAFITADEVRATLVTMERPINPSGGPAVKRTASFTVPKVDAGNPPTMTGPVFTGTKPWPFSLE